MARRAGPLAEQLAHHLRERLLQGDPRGGERVSELGVANEYGVARPTAKAALDILVMEGLVAREPYAALRVTTVEAKDVPEILVLLEVAERLAVARILRDGPDLRGVRDTARTAPDRVLESVVETAASTRLARTHRQGTLELALALSRRTPFADPGAPDLRVLAERLADALFRLDAEDAHQTLAELHDARRTACQTSRATAPAPTPSVPVTARADDGAPAR